MWKFDGREVYDRRVYFWNLLSATLWQVCLLPSALAKTKPRFVSIESGDRTTTCNLIKLYRYQDPYSWRRVYISVGRSASGLWVGCLLIVDPCIDRFQVGIWGFRASDECLLHVVRATLSAKPPPYETIMDLDSKIRNFTTVPKAGSSGPVDERTALSMRTFVRSHYQALSQSFFQSMYGSGGLIWIW